MDRKRIIIDVPANEHKRLKMKAIELGTSMKEMFLESIRLMEANACASSNHIPNEKTKKAMKNAAEEKNLISGHEAEEILKKLGL